MKIGRVYATFQTDFLYTEHYLARELKADGHETVFIASDQYLSSWQKYLKSKDGAGYYTSKDYTVHRLESWFPGGKAIYKSPSQLKQIILEENFDILHLYGLGTFSTLIVLCLKFFNQSKFPHIVISDHTDTRTHSREGWHAELYYKFFAFALKLVGGSIQKVVTFNDVGEQVLSKRFWMSANKFHAIPLGYDQDTYKFEPEKKNTEPKFVLGYAGKIDAKKRVDFLIKSLNESSLVDKSKLIVVGVKNDEYGKYLKGLAGEGKLEVEFRPFATKEELADFYNYIDLAVYPGGISITTIEANGSGIPVVVYKSIADLESRVENGRGKLFSTKEELIDCIHFYLEQHKRKQIQNGKIAEATRNSSSWRHIKKLYHELYEQVINNGK